MPICEAQSQRSDYKDCRLQYPNCITFRLTILKSGMDFLQDLTKQRPSELKKVVVVSVLKFTPTQIKELLKMGIHSVEEKPTNLQKLEIIKKNMWLK